MKRRNQVGTIFTGLMCIMALSASCTPLPRLSVTYRLPAQSDALKGKKVCFSFEDARASKEVIGLGARAEFPSLRENISVSIARGEEAGFMLGVFELSGLMREVFKARLERCGVEIVPSGERADAELAIVLKEFFLDLEGTLLEGRKWDIKMGYEARLIKGDTVLSTQTVTGEGERLKLIGTGQADTVLGEIVTDMVNRLDLPRLFQQAHL